MAFRAGKKAPDFGQLMSDYYRIIRRISAICCSAAKPVFLTPVSGSPRTRRVAFTYAAHE